MADGGLGDHRASSAPAWRCAGRRPIGRWPLAIVCGVVGFAFTAVQDVGDWVTYSDHSLAQLGVYVGQGLGFDAIYAGGCVVFALAFGPALLRSIQRFTRRLEITWLPPGSSVAPALAVAVALVGSAAVAGGDPHADGERGRASLRGPRRLPAARSERRRRLRRGSPGRRSSALFAGWAALGLQSAGVRLQTVDRGPGADRLHRAGARVRPTRARSSATSSSPAPPGSAPADFGGHDLVAMLRAKFAHDGSVGDAVNLTAFGILALRAAGVTVPARTAAWLEAQQDHDGGFGFASGAAPRTSTTPAPCWRRWHRRPGARRGPERRAIAYLRHQQDRDGGFPSQPGEGSNAQSTAWAVQGLDAAGVNPAGMRRGRPLAAGVSASR